MSKLWVTKSENHKLYPYVADYKNHNNDKKLTLWDK